ncbi:MAG: alcohol dehydrogenase catalytic domain-containing protein [Syntrophaceae bacterium]|mgnify:CR=1 FL=1|nr:alcohol dehydrogenase catalytic domain-containing protein [Syntrophaceae bacterium]
MKALLLDVSLRRYVLLRALRPLSAKFCYRGPFSAIRLADISEPALPSPEWVKIRTRLCGFCGSDLNLILMKDSPTPMPFTSFPCVPGHEFCGDVVETGREVTACRQGDRVTVIPSLGCQARGIAPLCPSCADGNPGNCENFAEGKFAPGMFIGICKDVHGAFAEYAVAHQSQVCRVPEAVSPEAATLTEPLAVGLQAVLDNRPGDSDRILVIGGGVIGTMIVKAIRGLDIACDITVMEPAPFAAAYVKSSGADRTFSAGILDAACAAAGGRSYKPALGDPVVMGGFHRIYDTVGHARTLNRSLRALAAKGTLSVLGIGPAVKLDLTPLWLKLQTIRGCYGYRFNETSRGRRQAFEIALEMIAEKKVRVDDMITHTFPIERYREMIDLNLCKNAGRAMKTAVRFTF